VPQTVNKEDRLDYTAVCGYDSYNKHGSLSAKDDYDRFLLRNDLNHHNVCEIVKIDDLVDMPEDYNCVYTGTSTIDGLGLFSRKDYLPGDVICPVRVGKNRTIAGRYSNHSYSPNAKSKKIDGKYFFVAICNIPSGDEITSDYDNTFSFRKKEGDL